MRRFLVWCLAIGILSVLGGCKNDSSMGPGGSGNGTLVVRLTDAPAAYNAIVIVVDSVRVHIDSADSVSGWYTISTSTAMYDLLQFTGGRDTVIATGEIPTGYYSQLRLFINPSSYIVVDGVDLPLIVPSGAESGLKLNIQASIAAGTQYVVALDFDAGHSIVVTGAGRYMLKPVIKVIATPSSGSLSGIVSPAAASPTIWATTGSDTSSTMSDTSGFFKFKYLAPASYAVTFAPADTTFQDTTVNNVTVYAGQNTNLGTVTLHKK